jgi:hypothetical protein
MPVAMTVRWLTAAPSSCPAGPIDPIVSLEVHYSMGNGEGVGFGSGFFVDPWRWTLVTAAHVLTGDAGFVPTRVIVGLGGTTCEAVACAYPTACGGAGDVAVVRLPWGVPGLTAPMPLASAPAAAFPATLQGYADAGPCSIEVLANRHGVWIRHSNGVGLPGMSGGALAADDGVVGVYIGDVAVTGGTADSSLSLDPHVLTALLEGVMK